MRRAGHISRRTPWCEGGGGGLQHRHRGGTKQRHFGRGIKTQSETKSDDIHSTGVVDIKQPAAKIGHYADRSGSA